MGYVDLASIVLVIVILACIQPFVHSSRRLANQASAVGSLRAINAAAITYASTYKHGFPPSLESLGPPKSENSNASIEPTDKAAGLIDESLASGTKSNYRFTYVAGPLDSNGKIQTYTVRAEPINPGVTGDNHYFTDQSGVIRQNREGKPVRATRQ